MKQEDIKKVGWFGLDVKPVRAGLYETQDPFNNSKTFMMFWDGFAWSWPDTRMHSSNQHRRWCGLTQEAHAAIERESLMEFYKKTPQWAPSWNDKGVNL